MSYKLVPTETFKNEVRRLIIKYPSIKSDLKELSHVLKSDPKAGISLGNNFYKIRIKNSDASKGKRGGYRVITYVLDPEKVVRLLTIYAKSQKIDISDQELKTVLRKQGL